MVSFGFAIRKSAWDHYSAVTCFHIEAEGGDLERLLNARKYACLCAHAGVCVCVCR